MTDLGAVCTHLKTSVFVTLKLCPSTRVGRNSIKTSARRFTDVNGLAVGDGNCRRLDKASTSGERLKCLRSTVV